MNKEKKLVWESVVWISWEKHRRTRELSNVLGIELHELIFDCNFLFRYSVLSLRTCWLIFKKKPSIVFVQCPSIVLTLLAIILKRFFCYILVIDAHNAAVYPNTRNKSWISLYKFMHRMADLTIVTNNALEKIIKSYYGIPFVLPDVIPHFSNYKKVELDEGFHLLFICSFSDDEPYLEVVEAARLLLEVNVTLHITGKYEKASRFFLENLPSNINLLGYLSEMDYMNLLYSVDGVIDLTLRNDCLVCGAYEAVALGKPLIISDTTTLRYLFSKGALYTSPNNSDIANSIKKLINEKEFLSGEVKQLKEELTNKEEYRLKQLEEVIKHLVGNKHGA